MRLSERALFCTHLNRPKILLPTHSTHFTCSQSLPCWPQCLLGPCYPQVLPLHENTVEQHIPSYIFKHHLSMTNSWQHWLRKIYLNSLKGEGSAHQSDSRVWFSWTWDLWFNRFSRHHGTTILLQMQQDWGTDFPSLPLNASPQFLC